MKFAFVFPGQGSQTVGMMTSYEDPGCLSSVQLVRHTFEEASEATGVNLWDIAQNGPAETQNLTQNTQPLMLTADIAVYRLWRHLGGKAPDVVAGHSLGEFAALVVSGVLNFSDAVRLVSFRARVMQEAVNPGVGAMAAILGLDVSQIEDICQEINEKVNHYVATANLNTPMQTVIAGKSESIELAMDFCKKKGAKRVLVLPVSAPFHCALMRPAQEKMAEYLGNIVYQKPLIPVINNVDAVMASSSEEIKKASIRQTSSRVRWVETLQNIALDSDLISIFECGPGKVLTGFTKKCVPHLSSSSLSDLSVISSFLEQNEESK